MGITSLYTDLKAPFVCNLTVMCFAMQDEATSGKPATELSADAAEFRLPHEEAAAPAASVEAETSTATNAGSAQAPKDPPAHMNGIATENGIEDSASNNTASENGLKSPAENVHEKSESGAERRDDEVASAQKSGKGGSVAKMVLSLEGSLKGRAALGNGLPNGITPGKEEPLLSKDPIVVQANGE